MTGMTLGEVSCRDVLSEAEVCGTRSNAVKSAETVLDGVRTGGDRAGNSQVTQPFARAFLGGRARSWLQNDPLWFSRPVDFLRDSGRAGATPPLPVTVSAARSRSERSRWALSAFDIGSELSVTFISRPLLESTPGDPSHETNLSTQGAPPETASWLPTPHADSRRPGRPQLAPSEGTQAPRRLRYCHCGTVPTFVESSPKASVEGGAGSQWLALPVLGARPELAWW